jgi:sugar phosphate isomerase/epimerase
LTRANASPDPADTREPARALNPALHGCETFDFGPADLGGLRLRLRAYAAFSVHAPLPTPVDYPGQPVTSFLLDADPAKRCASLDMLCGTIALAAQWNALYVVVHFAGLQSDSLSDREVSALAEEAATRLDDWAALYGTPVYLEYAAYNRSFATPEEMVSLVSRHIHLHVCLDVGHLRIAAGMLGIDEWRAAQLLAPYTRSMHLWTMRGREDVRCYHHVPVHPSLRPQDGWIDIPGMLRLVCEQNPQCAVVFEPNTLYNSDAKWQGEGMAWVEEIVAAYRG